MQPKYKNGGSTAKTTKFEKVLTAKHQLKLQFMQRNKMRH